MVPKRQNKQPGLACLMNWDWQGKHWDRQLAEINAHLIIKNMFVLICTAQRPRESIRATQKHLAGVHIPWRWPQAMDPNDSSLNEAGFPGSGLALLFPFIFNYWLIFYKIDSQSKSSFLLAAPLLSKYSQNCGIIPACKFTVHLADLSLGNAFLLSWNWIAFVLSGQTMQWIIIWYKIKMHLHRSEERLHWTQ